MTTLLFLAPWIGSLTGALMIGRALRDWKIQTQTGLSRNQYLLLVFALLAGPSVVHAQMVDLQAAVESGNAVIMYLSGTLAAVGIIAAGIAMMMGRHAIAKWAFAGAMVSGLAFAIVRTMWTNFGLTAPEVGAFAP